MGDARAHSLVPMSRATRPTLIVIENGVPLGVERYEPGRPFVVIVSDGTKSVLEQLRKTFESCELEGVEEKDD